MWIYRRKVLKRMTVQELIDLLKAYDDATEVKICDTRFPVYDPVEILDFDCGEDGAILIVGGFDIE